MNMLFGLIIFSFSFNLIAQENSEKPVARTFKDKNLKWGPCPEIFPKGCEVSVLNGDPSTGRSDVFLKVPGKYEIPAHSHTSPEHMTLVSGQMNVKYKDNDGFMLKEGSYAYGPAEHPHKATCVSKGPCVLQIVFERPIDAKPFNEKSLKETGL